MTTESIARRVFIAGEPFRLIARGWANTKQCNEAAALASVAFVFREARDAGDLTKLTDKIASQLGARGGLYLEPVQAPLIDHDTRTTLQDLRNDYRGR